MIDKPSRLQIRLQQRFVTRPLCFLLLGCLKYDSNNNDVKYGLNVKALANKVTCNQVIFNQVIFHKVTVLNLGGLGALGGKISQLTWQNV